MDNKWRYKNKKWKVTWIDMNAFAWFEQYHYTYIGALINAFILQHFGYSENVEIHNIKDFN